MSGSRRDSRGLGSVRFAKLGVVVFVCACAVVCVLLLVAGLVLSGCGPAAKVSADSPHVVSCALESSGDGTEAGQRVSVTLAFDGSVACEQGAEGDFSVTIDGDGLKDEAMRVTVEQVADDAVCVSIVPTDEAAAGKTHAVFACYAGQIEVGPARSDGALPHVVAAASDATAVMDEPVSGTVRSGMAIAVTSSVAGDAAAGVPASCTFSVERGPCLRCCTWLSLAGEPVGYIHNHQFMRETPESCAAELARMVDAAGCGFTATNDGASVTVTADAVVDGQVLSPALVEGLGVYAGSHVLM